MTRRSFSCLGLAVSLSALLLPAWLFAQDPVNLIRNGGFETGLAGWHPDKRHMVVKDSSQVHSGSACLTGELTKPKTYLRITQKVPVRKRNRYDFDIWARATNRTKLVLWAVPPGAQQRKMVAAWKDLPARWTRLRTAISVEADGELDLQLIAPSAVGAPPGKIWIDDVALYETAMPEVVNVSGDEGFNDKPTMARADDGSVYVSWLSFRDGTDTLQLARYQPQGESFRRLGAWQVVGGPKAYLLGPRLVSAGNQVFLLYAAERDGDWDVFACACGPGGPGQEIAVSDQPGVDVKPVGFWHSKTLHVAWESNRSSWRQIYLASVDNGKPSPSLLVSDASETHNYHPSIVGLEGGELCIAWFSFRQNNYDIFLRRRSPDGNWRAEERLTRAPSIDRHPVLFANGRQLWIAYENAQTAEYRISATNKRRIVLARASSLGLYAPKEYRRSPLYGRSEAAAACFDSDGRAWLAYLTPRLPRSGWDVKLTAFTGQRWQPPRAVSAQKGMDRTPALVLDDSKAFIAFQSDDLPRTWSEVDQTKDAASSICLAAVELPRPAGKEQLTLEALEEPDEPFEAGQIRIERGEDEPTLSTEYKGQTLKLYYGDLHQHTEVSVCNRVGDQSVDESYQSMRDIASLDFGAATDHGYNINPYFWYYSAKLSRTNHDPDRFLSFLGEEWTSSIEEYSDKHPYGFYGHRNLIFSDPYFPRWWNARNRQTPAEVWAELRELKADFVHIPHQLADTGNVPTDWGFTDELAQPVAEIFQVRGSYEYNGAPRQAKRSVPEPGYYIQDVWERGTVIGVIGSPDHGGGMGKACVFAAELSRKAIIEALRARRCFATTATRSFLDVRVNGHFMGEKVTQPPSGPVRVTIDVRCPADIDRVEVCRNNKFVYTNSPEGKTAQLTFTDMSPLPGKSYYYVRVIQKDEEISWSSPVFLGYAD